MFISSMLIFLDGIMLVNFILVIYGFGLKLWLNVGDRLLENIMMFQEKCVIICVILLKMEIRMGMILMEVKWMNGKLMIVKAEIFLSSNYKNLIIVLIEIN